MSNRFEQFAKEKESDDTPVDLEIVDRAGDPYIRTQDGKPMVFKVIGLYSAQFKAADRKIVNKALKKVRQGDEPDAEDSEAITIDKAIAALVGWTLEVGGDDVPFTKENAREFLSVAEWNVPRIRQRTTEHGRFFKRALAN